MWQSLQDTHSRITTGRQGLQEPTLTKECTCHVLSSNNHLRQRAVVHNPCC